MSRRRSCGILLALAALVAPAPARAAEGKPIPVVASFTILADLVRQVGGDRVSVTTLVGPNADVHAFSPAPSDASRIADAKLVVVNGLGLEGWLDRLVVASGTKAAVVTASRGIKPMEEKGAHRHAGQGASPHVDPHAWQSVGNAKAYVRNIRDGLVAADPQGRAAYEGAAERYLAALTNLESDIGAGLARIPAARRRIITTHDAFAYYAEAYGMTFVAPAGVSTESEASARDVGRIIRQIRAEKIPAVFLENVSDPRLMQRIAKESGAAIGGKVFSDALSMPGEGAGTYIDMMRSNLRAFEAALAVR